ncbi:hypothetical protein [Clostridium sp.]|uniref:hypothetical protein n=1 Tax=Clostridium sp. TaxID=1506 RepID=UPI0032174AC9
MNRISNMLRKNRNSNKKGNNIMKNNGLVNNNKINGGMNNMKTNKEMRMEKLQSAGVDTDKFFNLNLSNIPVGAPVQVIVNGVQYNLSVDEAKQECRTRFNTPTSWEPYDVMAAQIIEDGYVRNTKLHRRWVMAQTFKMLNSESRNYKTGNVERGWDAYLRNRFSYEYQFNMMLEEIRVLSILEKRDIDSFKERSSFFTKEVAIETCKQYIRQLKKYIKSQKTRKCKGVPYVKLNGYGNIFENDLHRRIYVPLEAVIKNMESSRNYQDLYNSLSSFTTLMAKLPYATPKCSQWKEAFKGSGAYYTLKNMIMFHDITFEGQTRGESIVTLNNLLEVYRGECWRFHELLKKTIKLNCFDLAQSIEAHK